MPCSVDVSKESCASNFEVYQFDSGQEHEISRGFPFDSGQEHEISRGFHNFTQSLHASKHRDSTSI
jgi:hypothetical protein